MRRNQKGIALVNLEIKKMFRKGAIKRTQPVQGEFLSNLLLVGKKGEGYRSVINLKILNQFVPFFHFKMERLSQFKALNTGLDVQTGIEGCILQCFIGSKLKEVCKFSVEEDSLQVHAPAHWTRSHTTGV